jgi:hypothetical protein
MPLAAIMQPSNVNEKRTTVTLLHKAVKYAHRVKSVVSDSQYSSIAFREVKRLGGGPVILHPRNQMRSEKFSAPTKHFTPMNLYTSISSIDDDQP